MTISRGGIRIQTLEDWEKHAGPKSPKHWVEDRSALEAARAWLSVASPQLPPEIANILARHPAFGAVTSWQAEPEARLPFDAFPGEPRNSDLAVFAADALGEFVIAIEAKADETLGETVADAFGAVLERRLANPRSNGVARIEQLAAALFTARGPKGPAVKRLRYQLLTATAGALRLAADRKVGRAVVLVQEFKTRLTNDQKHRANGIDLDQFIQRLSAGTVIRAEPDTLHGPFMVPGAPILTAPVPLLFVGKAVRNLRDRPAVSA